jgi:glutathione S-transferase
LARDRTENRCPLFLITRLSIFADADKIRPFNPLTRAPTFVLDDGTVLIESHLILDYLDHQVTEDRALFPRREPARHQALKVAALATGMADKGVSLFYEQRLHKQASPVWVERCHGQIMGVLAELENDREARATDYWFGDRIGHADIAVAVALRFLNEAHPGLARMENYRALRDHAVRLEALPVFREIVQAFIPPT